METRRPALFIDRDGVLNSVVMRGDVVSSPRNFQEFAIVPEAKLLVGAARNLGFLTVVVTNQPDIARGLLPPEDLSLMHQDLTVQTGVEHIAVCTSADDNDFRRKPNPGMMLECADTLKIELAESLIVGDSCKDIEAGRRAGIRTILLRRRYNQTAHGSADFECTSHAEIIDLLRFLKPLTEPE